MNASDFHLFPVFLRYLPHMLCVMQQRIWRKAGSKIRGWHFIVPLFIF